MAELAPRGFSARRDVPVAAGLAAVLALAAVGVGASLPVPAVVLLCVYATVAAAAWSQDLVRRWAVGDDWIAVRRSIRWTHLGVDDIRAVELDDRDPFGETLVFRGRGLRAVPVPLDRGRSEPAFGQQLDQLLDQCQRRGTMPPSPATDRRALG